MAALISVACVARADDVVLFPYFLNNGEAGVYLAASSDGCHFDSLNEGQPIFKPPQWPKGQSLTRDPSICYHDGKFHLVWTSSWTGRVFGCASSRDLVNWSTQLVVTPFVADLPAENQPGNV